MDAEGRALLNAILAAPEEDLPRLVYADWLEEHGELARAAYIRVEFELPTLEPGSRRRAELFGRHDLMRKAYQREWFRPFVRPGVEYATARGFVEWVRTGPAQLSEDGEEWFAEQPITRLKLTGVYVDSGGPRRWYHRELFVSPLLGRLRELDLSGAHVNSAGVYYLSKNKALSLRTLNLRYNLIDDEGVRTLSRMPALKGLRDLDLRDNPIGDAAARSLAESEHLGALENLWVSGRISPRGWEALEARFGRSLAR